MKIIVTGQTAREKLKAGIDLAVDCIKTTIGPSGRNAVLGRVDIPPYITNDGVSIARHIESNDELENQGVWIVKEALSVTSKEAGDATTTTAILIQAIVGEVFEKMKDRGDLIKKDINTIDIKRQIDKALEKVLVLLKKKSKTITDKQVYDVALTAGEFPWVAEIVSKVFKAVGKDGHVTIRESADTSYEIFNGVELNAGFHSDYYKNDGEYCKLNNPPILVTNNIMDSSPEFIELITTLTKQDKRSLLIIAPDFTPDLLKRFTSMLQQRDEEGKTLFTIVAIKLPTYDKDDILLDVATLSNAKFLDKNSYVSYEDYKKELVVENLGTVDSSVISSSNTVLLGGKGDTKKRVKALKQLVKSTTSVFDRDNLEKRIAYLSGGIAYINLNAQTEFEKMYYKLKMENAVNSTQNALKEGVIRGGGIGLMEAGNESKSILSNALRAPYDQIQKLTGGEKVPDNVIDSFISIATALKSACSVASTLITTEVLVALKKDDNKNQD